MADTTPYVPFGERPGWEDITPIEQDDGPADKPVVKILYKEEFADTMNYLRAVIRKDERSARALKLTEEAIMRNPANYTCWHFRRLCLEAVGFNVEDELVFASELVEDNPKNYQIWYHLRWIADRLESHERIIQVCDREIEEDSKNYHTWSLRQWVVEKWGLWESELEYSDRIIQEDFRNNSAWNERAFVVSKQPSIRTTQEELEYAIQFIRRAPNNLSPWNYIKALMRHKKFSDFPEVEAFGLEAVEKYSHSSNPYILMVDVYVEKNTVDSLDKAVEYCEILKKRDIIHTKFWTYRQRMILKQKEAL